MEFPETLLTSLNNRQAEKNQLAASGQRNPVCIENRLPMASTAPGFCEVE